MKFRTKPALRAVPAAQVQLSLNVQGVLRDVQQAFYGLCVNAGKQVLAAMMESGRVASTSRLRSTYPGEQVTVGAVSSLLPRLPSAAR